MDERSDDDAAKGGRGGCRGASRPLSRAQPGVQARRRTQSQKSQRFCVPRCRNHSGEVFSSGFLRLRFEIRCAWAEPRHHGLATRRGYFGAPRSYRCRRVHIGRCRRHIGAAAVISASPALYQCHTRPVCAELVYVDASRDPVACIRSSSLEILFISAQRATRRRDFAIRRREFCLYQRGTRPRGMTTRLVGWNSVYVGASRDPSAQMLCISA